MSYEQFESRSAHKRHLTVEDFRKQLRAQGSRIVRCECENPVCPGWKIVDASTVLQEE